MKPNHKHPEFIGYDDQGQPMYGAGKESLAILIFCICVCALGIIIALKF